MHVLTANVTICFAFSRIVFLPLQHAIGYRSEHSVYGDWSSSEVIFIVHISPGLAVEST